MSTAKINIKNIDYFKFKKIVIDGNRDDYASCSKEVKAFCDAVQTLSFRDDEFDEQSDMARFDEINTYYRQIIASKRIESLDMRIKSGWWESAGGGGGYSAGKIKSTALVDTLAAKTRDWVERHGKLVAFAGSDKFEEKLEGPGFFVFKHKEHQCYQYIGRADNVYLRCTELLKGAFEALTTCDSLSALFVISSATDWEFYFVPIATNDSDVFLRILENDLLVKHDSIWPHGLNFSLQINSLLEVSEFRQSCIRHRWPPEKADSVPDSSNGRSHLDMTQLRNLVGSSSNRSVCGVAGGAPAAGVGNGGKAVAKDRPSGSATGTTSNIAKLKPTRPTSAKVESPSPAPSIASSNKAPSSAAQHKPTSGGSKPAAAVLAAQTKAARAVSPSPHSTSSAVVRRTPSPAEINTHGDDKVVPGVSQEDEEDVEASVPTLKRSNTFTFSDSAEETEEKT